MSATPVTYGREGGEHRVLEPPGAVPLEATRLDALADLWDGELRLDLESIVLTASGHRSWTERLGSDPGRLSAAFVESVAERGGLGPEGTDATLLGTIAAVGPAHPHQVAVGERVGVVAPGTAIPLFSAPEPTWDGGRVIPSAGHAILPAGVVTVPVGDAPASLAALLTDQADVPTSLAPGRSIVVIGVERPAGALAVAAAAVQRRHVTAVVGSLGVARLARALGADGTAVVGAGEPVDGADHVLARASVRPDLVVLADPSYVALAVRLAHAVQVLTEPADDPTIVPALLRHARSLGRTLAIHAGRSIATDRAAALRGLLADRSVLLDTLRWQAGLGSLPTVPTGSDEEETP